MDLGGYAMKDHIWFYGAYDRVLTTRTSSRSRERAPARTSPRASRRTCLAAKLTFNIAQGTTIVGTMFADPQVNTGALAVPGAQSRSATTDAATWAARTTRARLNQLFGSFGILTAQYSQHKDRFETKPDGLDVVARHRHDRERPAVVSGGFGQVFGPTINNRSKRDQWSAAASPATSGTTSSRPGATTRRTTRPARPTARAASGLTIHPCGDRPNTCDLTQAPFYTNPPATRVQVFYQHSIFTASATDLTPLVTAPFDTPTKRWGAFVQDQWRIIPTLTVNAGLRWDQEHYFAGDGDIAFKLLNEWAPRCGFVWDFIGDGTSKLYGSAGRFFYAIPTDLNARVFTANTQVVNYNYSPTDSRDAGLRPRARAPDPGRLVRGRAGRRRPQGRLPG